MKIAILSIGDEVVMGKTVNTNASYVAKELESRHFVVSHHMAVRDTFEAIMDGLAYLYKEASVVITTGGLGPTVDDLTKEACAKYFNEEMFLNENELSKIRGYFDRVNYPMPENNKRQAYFINKSIVIKNDNGSAPGMIYEKDGSTVINLPGPPKELEPMLKETVIPYLEQRQHLEVIKRDYRLMNIGESHAETLIQSLYEDYPTIKIAPYASVGVVDYIISTNNKEDEELFKNCCLEFEKLMDQYIIGDTTKSINELIVDVLKEKNLTLAIAESCTGGMITSMIVDVPGSSSVLLEGLVTYSNDAKVNRLNVNPHTLETFGAVSEQVAKEMAIGVAKTSQTCFGLATTGIAGPSGGTPEKPVGLVYTAIAYQDKTWVYKHQYNGDRYKIRLRTSIGLLYALYQIIKAF